MNRRLGLGLGVGGMAAVAAVCIAIVVPVPSDDPGVVRPLSADEASRLAEALSSNYECGGAAFTAQLDVDDETVAVAGTVDWADHVGYALTDLGEVYWTEHEILEPATAGRWTARPLDPATNNLDRLLVIVGGLGTPNRDNALLIRQEPGSANLGPTTLPNGTPVDQLRYGTGDVYLLRPDTVDVAGYRGTNLDVGQVVAVDFHTCAPPSIPGPLASEVIP